MADPKAQYENQVPEELKIPDQASNQSATLEARAEGPSPSTAFIGS